MKTPVIALLALLSSTPTPLAAVQELSELASLEGRRITAIEIEGNRVTREAVILRELQTKAGQRLRLSQLAADAQRLDNLDIFSSIKIAGAVQGDGVTITFRVREMPSVVPYVSYEIGDEDGLAIGPALRSVNMAGRDISIASFAHFGGRTSYLIDVRDPWVAGNHLSLSLKAARIQRTNELDGFKQTSFELSPQVGTYVGVRGRAGLGLTYLSVRSDEPGHTLSSSNIDRMLRLRVNAGYDSRDSWSDPHRGWLNEIEITRTGGPLSGGGDFWTATLDVRRFQPVRSHTLVMATLLTLQSGRTGESLPEYMDFHLGGPNTIRGYDVKQLGSTLRGRHQLLSTLEYRVTLVRPSEIVVLGQAAEIGLAGAFFSDGGVAWDRRDQLNAARVKIGVGFGLRLLLPAVEMTRFDVAVGEDGTWRIAFAAFSKMAAQRLWLR